MLRSMTIRQFLEWQHYEELEPFGEERDDYRTANVVQTLLNIHRKKGRPPFKIDECVIRFGRGTLPDLPTSVEQARQQVLATMGILMQIYNN